MINETYGSRPACPPWCTRLHVGPLSYLAHKAVMVDVQLEGARIAVSLGYTEYLTTQSAIGPFMNAELTIPGDEAASIDLSAGQVRALAQILGTSGVSELIADVATTAAAALDENSHAGFGRFAQVA